MSAEHLDHQVATTVGALQTALLTLPGTGYRAVSASWDSPTPGVGLMTVTVSVGEPDDEGEQ